ncbi:MAG: EAL domain-containing protein [Pseudomonadota bacterium]
MRKTILSNLLLWMFLIGAASGFMLSNVAWWSLRSSNRDLDQVYQAASAAPVNEASASTLRAYEGARNNSRNAQQLLLALSLLATTFFSGAAWLTYRQTVEARRKSAQLAREHALFKTLFHGTSDGILLMNEYQIVDCNHAALRLFGAASALQLACAALDQIQPRRQPDGTASGPALRARLALAAQVVPPCFEWQFRALDGVEFCGEVTINAASVGRDHVLQLMVRDISARKLAERTMRLANQAFENSLEGITITDANRNILTVNRAFTTITGYRPEEVVGRNPSMLSSGRQTPEFYAAMWAELNQRQEWQGEIWNIRKDGEVYPQWLNITQVCDERGVPINYVGVFSDISELKAAHARNLHAVYYDQLTNLPNRVLLTDRLNQLSTKAARDGETSLALMFMDLDRLKVINDSMGREAGDALLQMVAARLAQGLRETDTLARMNGDEFAILLAPIASAEEASTCAQAILHRFEEPFELQGELVHVSLSIGISVYPTDGTAADALLQYAAMAMYRAKKAGGVCYALYDEELGAQASKRMAIETGLRRAVECGELELRYQPQFDCRSGALLGFEALLRWRHPELGLIAPAAFLGIAEETGLIVPIGAWVLKTACIQAQAWNLGASGRMMAVNLSARQLQHPDIAEHVTEALATSGLPARCLELEITESVMMHRLDSCLLIMHRLSALGIEFSIDDFGTGYSSLSYLKKMPIKALKIDRSFIRDIVTDSDGASIVGAIVAMANTLGLRVVAEGIEEPDQLTHLRAYRGIIGQGYLLGRPATAASHAALFEASAADHCHAA